MLRLHNRKTQGIVVLVLGALATVLILTLLDAGSGQPSASAVITARGRTVTSPAVRNAPRRDSPSPKSQGSQPGSAHVASLATGGAAVPTAKIEVGETTLRFVDPVRTVTFGGRTVARRVDAIVRYPIGPGGRFPLIVFGHGFAVTPTPYSDLLDAWTKAGYVVAAPIFPLENANAPGGPNEKDLVNQPADMSLVISSLTDPGTPKAHKVASMIDFSKVAVSGQSDGGDTALGAAYDPAVRDPRIKAAVILSGAEDPFASQFRMPPNGPPLLAVQGTADTVNPPWQTYAFFRDAAPPKYLLKLIGAGHQPPYTERGPDLRMVEHMTLAFLDRYLKGRPAALARYAASRSAGPGSTITFER